MEQQSVLITKSMHYCPGCTHRTIHHMLASVFDELNLGPDLIGIAPVGCASYLMKYLDIDIVAGPHGRAPAMATAIKRLTKKVVFTYQGDGDLASIGTGEIFHAAVRGEGLTVIYVNNASYGMTSGQVSPTSLIGQYTKTSKNGKDIQQFGYPFDIMKSLSTLPGVLYAERVACNTKENMNRARQAIKKAFLNQMNNEKGLSIIEILAICPSSLRMSVPDSNRWLENKMSETYPLMVLKDTD